MSPVPLNSREFRPKMLINPGPLQSYMIGGQKKRKMQNITINLPEAYCDNLQRLIQLGLYPSRSEAIRVALREFLDREFQFLDLLHLREDADSEGLSKA